MTNAERWRKEKPKDFESTDEFFNLINELDPKATFINTDLGAVIRFSDGSTHRMGSVD